MRTGIDYAWARPSPGAIRGLGYDFVCRYLSYDTGKNLSAGELGDLRAAGLDVVVVWETTATRALSGYAGGRADANEAQRQVSTLGYPAAVVYLAVDFDSSEAQQPAINDYLNGAASVLGLARTGVYGSYYVIERCLRAGVARYGWQTVAWSGGQQSSLAHIYQPGQGDPRLGSVDVNYALQSYFGQVNTPATSSGGFLMALTDAEQAEILTAVRVMEARLADSEQFLGAEAKPQLRAVFDLLTRGRTLPPDGLPHTGGAYDAAPPIPDLPLSAPVVLDPAAVNTALIDAIADRVIARLLALRLSSS